MANSEDIRWKQRLGNFKKAMARLEAACFLEEYSELELAGLAQTFEFSFELGWKTLKDLLVYQGTDAGTPREVFRAAFAAGYLTEEETETLLQALEKRNVLSHTYREEIAKEAEVLIKDRYFPVLRAVLERLEEKAAQ